MSYLNKIHSTEVANGYKEDIDLALLKLYAEADHDSLLGLLVTENFWLLTDNVAWMEKHKKYFALGLVYHYNKQDASASQLWVNIVNGYIQDSTRSDLYEYIIDFLTYCLDQELVWTHADWLLQKSEETGVQVLTRRPLEEQQQTSFNPDDIISCLKKYPKALVKSLEHLIIYRRLQKEEYHTHLAILYLEEVLWQRVPAGGKDVEATGTQAKLRRLLQKSDLYCVQLLKEKVQGAGLPMSRVPSSAGSWASTRRPCESWCTRWGTSLQLRTIAYGAPRVRMQPAVSASSTHCSPCTSVQAPLPKI